MKLNCVKLKKKLNEVFYRSHHRISSIEHDIILLDHNLNVNGTDGLESVVLYVADPGSALYVDQHTRFWPLKMHSDQGAKISLLVGVWEVVSGETSMWQVLDRANVLTISWILSLA